MSGDGSNSSGNSDTYYQTRVPELYAATITLAVLQTIAVVARFAARRISAANFWWDDYTIVLALVRNANSCSKTPRDKFLGLQYLRSWTSGSAPVTGSQSEFVILAVTPKHMAGLLPWPTFLSSSK